MRRLPTILYPEQKGLLRRSAQALLTTRDDGTLKCVACYMCAQACPAECITIVAGEHPKLAYEKYPVVFDIDMLRCVYCGFCVDACPKDAIWMTGDYEMAFFNRQEAVFGISKLAARPGLPVKDGGATAPIPGDVPSPPRRRRCSRPAGGRRALSGCARRDCPSCRAPPHRSSSRRTNSGLRRLPCARFWHCSFR